MPCTAAKDPPDLGDAPLDIVLIASENAGETGRNASNECRLMDVDGRRLMLVDGRRGRSFSTSSSSSNRTGASVAANENERLPIDGRLTRSSVLPSSPHSDSSSSSSIGSSAGRIDSADSGRASVNDESGRAVLAGNVDSATGEGGDGKYSAGSRNGVKMAECCARPSVPSSISINAAASSSRENGTSAIATRPCQLKAELCRNRQPYADAGERHAQT